MRVHVIQTGSLVGNKTFMRGSGWGSVLRPREDFEFPAYSFLIEHPDGPIAIDTGMTARLRSPRPWVQRRFVPRPMVDEEIGPRMRAVGLDPADVRTVVLTHFDWDHAGGLAHFPDAEVLVHRQEHAFASTRMGRLRYEPELWPSGFEATLYDLSDGPYGPFPSSRSITADGTVRVVPLPGHTIGQVGVIVRVDEMRLFFTADHMLRQDWFCEDFAAGRLLGLGIFFPKLARETSHRIHSFVSDVPTLLVPSHDAEVPERLAAMEPLEVGR